MQTELELQRHRDAAARKATRTATAAEVDQAMLEDRARVLAAEGYSRDDAIAGAQLLMEMQQQQKAVAISKACQKGGSKGGKARSAAAAAQRELRERIQAVADEVAAEMAAKEAERQQLKEERAANLKAKRTAGKPLQEPPE